MVGEHVVGACMAGGMHSGGHTWLRRVCLHGRRDSHSSGRYASY